MESIGSILTRSFDSNPKLKRMMEMAMNKTPKERVEFKVNTHNAESGCLDEIDGYNCDICKNRGDIAYVVEIKDANGNVVDWTDSIRDCKCMRARESIKNMHKSGLAETIKKYRFDNYDAETEAQKAVKAAAMRFPGDGDTNIFFIGGGIGFGKTHLCTAVAAQYLRQGKSVRYMLWKDEVVKIKATVNDAYEHERLMNEYKNVEVLYIDDFLKIVNDRDGQYTRPSEGDMNVAYEIINHRYFRDDLITIISSERYMQEIVEIDAATGSRIYDRCKHGYCFNVKRDPSNNYRLRGMTMIG